MNERQMCPRCSGVVLDDPFEVEKKCVTCGWHPRVVPDEVKREVEAYKGKSNIGHNRKRPPRRAAASQRLGEGQTDQGKAAAKWHTRL